ncbi:hypothetical protein SESBI_19795 [Sesbania bispinosa]|nr:hypothetical protein SESBI_19795 [Sesbania bispinosa]
MPSPESPHPLPLTIVTAARVEAHRRCLSSRAPPPPSREPPSCPYDRPVAVVCPLPVTEQPPGDSFFSLASWNEP